MSWWPWQQHKHVYAHWVDAKSYCGRDEISRQCTLNSCRHIERRSWDGARAGKFEPEPGLIVQTRQENLKILGLEEYPR